MDDLSFEEWYELMEEPPGGFNHGRKKTEAGDWIPLETIGMDEPSFKRCVSGPHKHGTAYAYTRLRCRCERCRNWKREYNRAHR